jgi:hypothetical protein
MDNDIPMKYLIIGAFEELYGKALTGIKVQQLKTNDLRIQINKGMTETNQLSRRCLNEG